MTGSVAPRAVLAARLCPRRGRCAGGRRRPGPRTSAQRGDGHDDCCNLVPRRQWPRLAARLLAAGNSACAGSSALGHRLYAMGPAGGGQLHVPVQHRGVLAAGLPSAPVGQPELQAPRRSGLSSQARSRGQAWGSTDSARLLSRRSASRTTGARRGKASEHRATGHWLGQAGVQVGAGRGRRAGRPVGRLIPASTSGPARPVRGQPLGSGLGTDLDGPGYRPARASLAQLGGSPEGAGSGSILMSRRGCFWPSAGQPGWCRSPSSRREPVAAGPAEPRRSSASAIGPTTQPAPCMAGPAGSAPVPAACCGTAITTGGPGLIPRPGRSVAARPAPASRRRRRKTCSDWSEHQPGTRPARHRPRARSR